MEKESFDKKEKKRGGNWKGLAIGVGGGILVVAVVVAVILLVAKPWESIKSSEQGQLKCANEENGAVYEFDIDDFGQVKKVFSRITVTDTAAQETFEGDAERFRERIASDDEEDIYKGAEILADNDKEFSLKAIGGDMYVMKVQGSELTYEWTIERGSSAFFKRMEDRFGGTNAEKVRWSAESTGIVCEE